MSDSFQSLGLSAELDESLATLGFAEMTPVQAQSLPSLLAGKDLTVQAKTGSGKTIAFGLGVINKLEVKNYAVQALVLCPTRELADQVAKVLRRLASLTGNIKILTLCGGMPIRAQVSSLTRNAHIVVGTPGRILKLLKSGDLTLDSLNTLVLDEADRMLDMGFNDDIMEIIARCNEARQTLLFSATYPEEIDRLSQNIQRSAIKIETTATEPENAIEEIFVEVIDKGKKQALVALFNHYRPENVIIFCNTKLDAKALEQSLQTQNIAALSLHGDLEQYQRNDVLVQFINQSCCVLVATDVAARGIDIKELSMVINYDLPYDQTVYTHRIGRTGRAGSSGLALTLYGPERAVKADTYKNGEREFKRFESYEDAEPFVLNAPNKTLVINAGKKDKIRAGDILGALTKDCGVDGKKIGKIEIFNKQSYVAIEANVFDKVLRQLQNKKIKNIYLSFWDLAQKN